MRHPSGVHSNKHRTCSCRGLQSPPHCHLWGLILSPGIIQPGTGHGWSLPFLKHCFHLTSETPLSWFATYLANRSFPMPVVLLHPLTFLHWITPGPTLSSFPPSFSTLLLSPHSPHYDLILPPDWNAIHMLITQRCEILSLFHFIQLKTCQHPAVDELLVSTWEAQMSCGSGEVLIFSPLCPLLSQKPWANPRLFSHICCIRSLRISPHPAVLSHMWNLNTL